MPRNGSGVFTPSENFATEAASPPIEISKLDDVLVDIGTALTGSVAADGQTNPSADLKMNGFRHTNVGAATALNQYGRVTEIIDQDYVFYVDTGAADAYVITPAPAIAAYEEGQRFVFRAIHANTTASTLNVNGLGAIAIQTNDGAALTAGAILLGGYYEVTYDANASPDRWVLDAPSDLARLGITNTFTAAQIVSNKDFVVGTTAQLNATANRGNITINGSATSILQLAVGGTRKGYAFHDGTDMTLASEVAGTLLVSINSVDVFKLDATGVLTSPNLASATGWKGAPARSITATDNTAAADIGKSIRMTGGTGQTLTLDADPATDAVVILVNSSGNSWTIAASGTLTFAGNTGSRTLATGCMAAAIHNGSGNWYCSGQLS